jgi:hypothetical protein
MAKYWAWITAIAFAAAGCATTATQQAASSSGLVASSELKIVLTRRCAINRALPEVAALGGALLAPIAVALVNEIIDATGNALMAAGQPVTISYPLSYSYDFYQVDGQQVTLNPGLLCITIYKQGQGTGFTGDWADSSRTPASVGLSANPDFYFEGYIVLSGDHTNFRLQPQHFEYNDNLWNSIFTSTRDIVITFDFQKPAGDQTKAFATSKLIFHDVRPGTKLESGKLQNLKMEYMPLPTIEEPAKTWIQEAHQAAAQTKQLTAERDEIKRSYTEKEKSLAEQRRQLNRLISKDPKKILDMRESIGRLEPEVRIETIDRFLSQISEPEQRRSTPVNLYVVVAETRDGIALLTAAGRVLQGASSDLKNGTKTALNNALLPSAIEANKQAERNTSNTAQLNVLQADLDVIQKLKEQAELSATSTLESRAVVEQNLRIAKLKANIAYQAAGLPEPYPEARPK